LKVLLTGANGFVGSHVLDALRARGFSTAILLRRGANTRLIQDHLQSVEVREAALRDAGALQEAITGITHVIHCAGCTKAASAQEFFDVNEGGTRNLLKAFRRANTQLERFVHISSLAAAGPGTSSSPSLESNPPNPVSVYGKSKLAAEGQVRALCPEHHVILRPPAVYGPRDAEFLRVFKAVGNHLAPKPRAQGLSLVFVLDLARVVIECLGRPAAAKHTYNVACPEVVTARTMAEEIARQMNTWTVPVPLPNAVFWALCLGQEGLTRLTGKANVLSLQKYSELRAEGWVSSPSLMERELGLSCDTKLTQGIERTMRWYRENNWL
jgi:nucleoside-diphosphate-sugar epimerase